MYPFSIVLIIDSKINSNYLNLEDWKLIQKCITGNAQPEQQRKLQKWLERHPDNKKLYREIEKIWELTPEEEFKVDVQQAWEQFNYRKELKRPETKYGTNKNSEKLIYLFRAAAVILIALFTGYLVQATLTNSNENTTKESASFYVMQDLITEEGEKARITFPDGTEVILNAASTLRFPKEFHGSKREVHLDGEAYFKVAHDVEHPFIVQAQNARVQVLGTEFNVKAWKGDSSVDVAVREGKVSVNNTDTLQDFSQVILTKGELTRVYPERGISPIQKVNVNNHLLWTRGGMHFDNVPFSQVIRQLERKFNVSISVSDNSLLDVPFTSTFRQAELNKILDIISETMGVKYTKKGSVVQFK